VVATALEIVAVVDAQTGAEAAPVGLAVIAQVRVTVPVKPPDGVRVMVEAAESPGLAIVTPVAEMAIDGTTAASTVTGTVVEAVIIPVAASTPLTASV
jgi:hypothetical protein